MEFHFAGNKIRLLALAVTVFVALFVIFHRSLYLNPELELEHGVCLFVLSLVAAPAIGFLIVFRCSVSKSYRIFANALLFFLMPILSIQMVECFDGVYVWWFSVSTFLANYLTYLVFYLLLYLIIGGFHFAALFANVIFYVWAIINYFVNSFRGTPFLPMDILSARTGLSVADGYVFSLSWQLIMASILFVMIYLLNKHLAPTRAGRLKGKVVTRLLPAAYLGIILTAFFFTDFPANAGFKPDFWNQARGYSNTGSFFNYCLNLKYLSVKKPSGYRADKVGGYVDDALADYGVDPDGDVSTNLLTGENDYSPSENKVMPNIICIMNESFADLSILGDLETNEDYMPFIRNMSGNTIKGYLTMPVFGAGTSNSEYEFLTGDSISVLPSGCNVYQSYIKHAIPSLVSTLTSLGYTGTAYHPYYGDGWNRENVFSLMGFDDFISIEDFVDEDILDTYKKNNNSAEYEALLKSRYPDKDMLLRRFISDSYDYTMIEEMYEERDTSSPFFLFNVTMQNHGGYLLSYSNFLQTIYATNLSGSYPMANRYLSLIKESDAAFSDLLAYFSNVEEPTIICMFGDHQPSVENGFYEELLGTDLNNLTLEQDMLRYQTPFVIWANYDIEEADVGAISSNYLSTLLCQVAGLPMTQYQKYLSVLYQELPIITTIGYADAEGNYYKSDANSKYEETLHRYNCLIYNNLVDYKNRDNSLFYLD